jgi:hypothetical protein
VIDAISRWVNDGGMWRFWVVVAVGCFLASVVVNGALWGIGELTGVPEHCRGFFSGCCR